MLHLMRLMCATRVTMHFVLLAARTWETKQSSRRKVPLVRRCRVLEGTGPGTSQSPVFSSHDFREVLIHVFALLRLRLEPSQWVDDVQLLLDRFAHWLCRVRLREEAVLVFCTKGEFVDRVAEVVMFFTGTFQVRQNVVCVDIVA